MFAPAVIKWAREVAELDLREAAFRIGVEPKTFRAWEDEEDEREPSLRQVERMAARFNVPFRYLLGDEPPEGIRLPKGYLSTPPSSKAPGRPSFDLQRAMGAAKIKQNWLSEHRRSKGRALVLPNAVQNILDALEARTRAFKESSRSSQHLGKMLEGLIRDLWEIGFIVIRNDVVDYYSARKLDAKEFHGFAMMDEYAPVIFINGNASKAEQALVLIHGLAYLLRRQDERAEASRSDEELEFSRAVAEERASYGERHEKYADVLDAAIHLREVARDMPAAGRSNGRSVGTQPREDMDKMLSGLAAKGAGKFWNAVPYKSGGPGFLSAVISSSIEDEILIRDAFELTGLKGYPFNELAVRMGFPHVLRLPADRA